MNSKHHDNVFTKRAVAGLERKLKILQDLKEKQMQQ